MSRRPHWNRWALAALVICASFRALANTPSPAVMSDSDAGPTPEDRVALEQYRNYQRQLLSHLRESVEPRDWALASELSLAGDTDSTGAPVDRQEMLRNAAAAAPNDPLVQWLAANNISSSGDGACGSSLPKPEFVAALMTAAPDNGAALLMDLDAALRAKDKAGVDDILLRVTAAPHFTTYVTEALRAWVKVYQEFGPPDFMPALQPGDRAGRDKRVFVLAISHAAAMTGMRYSAVSKACNVATQDAGHSWQRASLCEDMGRHISQVSSSILNAQMGLLVVKKTGRLEPADESQQRELTWLSHAPVHVEEESASPAVFRSYLADTLALDDEREVMRRLLKRLGMSATPPATWPSSGPTRMQDGPAHYAPSD